MYEDNDAGSEKVIVPLGQGKFIEEEVDKLIELNGQSLGKVSKNQNGNLRWHLP